MNNLKTIGIRLVIVLALYSGAILNVSAQSISGKFFGARENGSSQAACYFLAKDDTNSSQNRKFFLSRPEGQVLSFTVISGLAVSAATIDATLEAASAALQQDNSVADVGCCVEIRRQGGVGTFTQPSGMVGGVIQDSSDLSAVNSISGNVKIVAAINFCGQNGTYAGCRVGNSLVVTSGFAAATIAHEFGHMQGLCHVGTNCNPTCGQAGNCVGCGDPSASSIMYFSICAAATQNVITNAQCTSFRSGATP